MKTPTAPMLRLAPDGRPLFLVQGTLRKDGSADYAPDADLERRWRAGERAPVENDPYADLPLWAALKKAA